MLVLQLLLADVGIVAVISSLGGRVWQAQQEAQIHLRLLSTQRLM